MSLVPAGAPVTGQVTLTTATPVAITTATGVGGTVAAQLAARSHAPQSVKITALGANTAKVYVGPATVTTALGDELPAGASVSFDHCDPAQIFVVGTTGDKVSVLLILAG